MPKNAKTAVNGGEFVLTNINNSNKEIFPNLQSLHDALDSIDNETQYTVHQQTISATDLVKSIQIEKKLGNGSFGAAFLAYCKFFGGLCVVKFPNALLQNGKITINNKTLNFVPAIPVDETTKRDFQQEKDNLFKVLTPEKMLDSHAHKFKEGRLEVTSIDQYKKLKNEASNFKIHDGHRFLHQFLHTDDELYCIISEPCENDVFFLLQRRRLDTLQNKRAFFIQVGLAVHYMLFVLKVAHTDIKPGNIFWKMESGKYIFKVSDFGYLDDINALTTKPDHINYTFVGTEWYMPRFVARTQDKMLRYNTPKIMLFAFFTTVLEVLNIDKYDPDIVPFAFPSDGNSTNYPPKYTWLEQLNQVATPCMHEMMYSFLGKTLDSEYWIYPGKEPTSWMDSFNTYFRHLIQSHNCEHRNQQYSIHS